MKLLGIINELIPKKLMIIGLILGAVILFIVGLIYDLYAAVAAVAMIIAIFKYEIIDKLK
ncbi:hypothetical protein [Alkaliphilus sp. B6464]|uniref:hypothetical protein n=1 Tax=Alkaliphilus sp. B6464 TaxID=2731219 RepID=UPI001BAC282B|nr:hypothetical protein [Alkaliphilus sp. B6464]QUH20351.1 hypothetical protein HYG84_10865 [Alkaliphilus sp. B6464]